MAAGLGARETQVQIPVLPLTSSAASGMTPVCRATSRVPRGHAQRPWHSGAWACVSDGRGGGYSLLSETQNLSR